MISGKIWSQRRSVLKRVKLEYEWIQECPVIRVGCSYGLRNIDWEWKGKGERVRQNFVQLMRKRRGEWAGYPLQHLELMWRKRISQCYELRWFSKVNERIHSDGNRRNLSLWCRWKTWRTGERAKKEERCSWSSHSRWDRQKPESQTVVSSCGSLKCHL